MTKICQNSKTIFCMFFIAFSVPFVDGKKSIMSTPYFVSCLVVVLYIGVLAGQARKQHNTGRVVGGHLAEHENFPFIVSIQKYKEIEENEKRWVHVCGGSIVNPLWVLTACHCVAHTKEKPLKYKDVENYRVVAGVTSWKDTTPERQEVGAKQFFAHHKCYRGGVSRQHTYYDTGLVELLFPLTYSFQVQPLKLFSRDPETAFREQKRLQVENAHCLTPGWGRVAQIPIIERSPHLKSADQILLTAKQCHETLCQDSNETQPPEGKCANFDDIDQACISSDDASFCHGDSGGPLVCNGYVFGVTSQVGSSCAYKGMQIVSGIRSILCVINNYVPDTEHQNIMQICLPS